MPFRRCHASAIQIANERHITTWNMIQSQFPPVRFKTIQGNEPQTYKQFNCVEFLAVEFQRCLMKFKNEIGDDRKISLEQTQTYQLKATLKLLRHF